MFKANSFFYLSMYGQLNYACTIRWINSSDLAGLKTRLVVIRINPETSPANFLSIIIFWNSCGVNFPGWILGVKFHKIVLDFPEVKQMIMSSNKLTLVNNKLALVNKKINISKQLFVCLLVVAHEVSHQLFTDRPHRFGSDTPATENSWATINVSYVRVYSRRVSVLTVGTRDACPL